MDFLLGIFHVKVSHLNGFCLAVLKFISLFRQQRKTVMNTLLCSDFVVCIRQFDEDFLHDDVTLKLVNNQSPLENLHSID